jgi:hypothetical protein
LLFRIGRDTSGEIKPGRGVRGKVPEMGHVKGIGEAGVLPIPAAIVSAVEHALAPFGIRLPQFPLRPRDLAAMLAEAGVGKAAGEQFARDDK